MGRSQVAMEYIILIGVLLILLIPILYYALSSSNESARLNQANDAVVSLAKAADTVYALGPGNRNYVWVNIPSGSEMAIDGANKLVLIKLSIYGSQSDIYQTTKGTLEAGSIGGTAIQSTPTPIGKGTYRVKVEYKDDGTAVKIGE